MPPKSAPPILYAFKVVQAHSQGDVDEAQASRQAAMKWTDEENAKFPRFWTAEPGSIGWCRGKENDMNGYTLVWYVRMTTNGLQTTNLSGYIPRRCIQQGNQRAENGVPTKGFHPSARMLVDPKRPGQQGVPDKFTAFVKALFSNFNNEQNTLMTLGFSGEDIKWVSSGNDEALGWIEKGMENAGTRSLFKNGPPDHGTLFQHRPIRTAVSHYRKLLEQNPGIYALLYRINLGAGNWRWWWYVGKAIDIELRLYDHMKQIKSPSPPSESLDHYGPAKEIYQHKDGSYCCVALATWQPKHIDGMNRKLLRCAEQVFQCALLSMSDRVLALPRSLGAYIAHGQDYSAGTFLHDMCLSIGKKLEWTWDPNIKGMNFSMAMAEVARSEKVVWLRQDVTDDKGQITMRVFCRNAVYVRAAKKGSKRIQIIAWQDHSKPGGNYFNFRMCIPQEWQIPVGQRVNVIVEMMPPNKLHQKPYMRYSSVSGPFSNWRDLFRMGIRLEWQGTEGWKSIYAQAPTLFKMGGDLKYKSKLQKKGGRVMRYSGYPETPHLTTAYTMAYELYSSLNQIRYTPQPPAWMSSRYDCVIVQKSSYDHLQQCHNITRVMPEQLDAPVLRSFDANHKALSSRFGLGLAVGEIPKDFSKGQVLENERVGIPRKAHKVRSSCDTCYLLRIGSSVHTPKKKSKCKSQTQGDQTSCARCTILRQPCTWTTAAEVINNGWQDLILRSNIDFHTAIANIPGPTMDPGAPLNDPEDAETNEEFEEDEEDDDEVEEIELDEIEVEESEE